jgi:hypothetical protein
MERRIFVLLLTRALMQKRSYGRAVLSVLQSENVRHQA